MKELFIQLSVMDAILFVFINFICLSILFTILRERYHSVALCSEIRQERESFGKILRSFLRKGSVHETAFTAFRKSVSKSEYHGASIIPWIMENAGLAHNDTALTHRIERTGNVLWEPIIRKITDLSVTATSAGFAGTLIGLIMSLSRLAVGHDRILFVGGIALSLSTSLIGIISYTIGMKTLYHKVEAEQEEDAAFLEEIAFMFRGKYPLMDKPIGTKREAEMESRPSRFAKSEGILQKERFFHENTKKNTEKGPVGTCPENLSTRPVHTVFHPGPGSYGGPTER